jgi:hypothetical protein
MIDYTGQDLIFATGAPGSKWSRILSLIGLHPEVNNSDKDKFPKYNMDVTFLGGKTLPVGNHTGAYFGPGNVIGEQFLDLTKLTKDEFLEEIKKPFDNWEQGVKIVKSHWFSYGENLNWIRENFPDSKMLLVYNGDEVAFKWWHFVGGWDITFPSYTWYATDQRMYEKILEENRCLLKFAKDNLIPVKFYPNFKKLLLSLDLDPSLDFLNNLNEEDLDLVRKVSSNERALLDQFDGSVKGAAVGVYSTNSERCNSTNEFDQILLESQIQVATRHEKLGVDKLLTMRHGLDWENQINTIINSFR